MNDLEMAKEINDALNRNREKWPERLNSMLGLALADCSREERYADFEFRSQDWMKNPYDGVHGGIISSVFDTCMGFGAVVLSHSYVSTTDLAVSFLKAMTGEHYRIHVEYTQIGRRMIRGISKAVDAKTGVICATAMASFMTAGPLDKGGWA